jgi:hypothetical protein
MWARAELQALWMRIYADKESGRSWVVRGRTVLLDPVRVLEILAEMR